MPSVDTGISMYDTAQTRNNVRVYIYIYISQNKHIRLREGDNITYMQITNSFG